jgi:CBS domain-containing protein
MHSHAHDRSIAVGTAALGGVGLAAHAAIRARVRRRRRARSSTPAAQLMTRGVTCVDESASVLSAAERLAEAGVGALPVCDRQGRLLGMLTDRDIVVRVIAQGLDPRRTAVSRCLEREPVGLGASETASTAVRRMAEHRIRRLPVVDESGRLTGIVGQSDLAYHVPPSEFAILEREIARDRPDRRSAAWLLAQPYRDPAPAAHSHSARERRSDDGTLADGVRSLLHQS